MALSYKNLLALEAARKEQRLFAHLQDEAARSVVLIRQQAVVAASRAVYGEESEQAALALAVWKEQSAELDVFIAEGELRSQEALDAIGLVAEGEMRAKVSN